MAKKKKTKATKKAGQPSDDSGTKRRREALKKGQNGLSFDDRRVGVSVSMKNRTWQRISDLAQDAGMSISGFLEDKLCRPFLDGLLVPRDAKEADLERERKAQELRKKKRELEEELAALGA